MTARSPPPAAFADDRYRTAPEARIRELLLLSGFAFEIEAGGEAAGQAAIAQALDDWTADGLGFRRDVGGDRLFDPVEVLNHLKWAGLTGRDGFWAERFVATGRALGGAWEGEAEAGWAAPRRFEATLARTFDLAAFAPGQAVRLRLPLPLDAARVDLVVPPELGAATHAADGRLEVRLARPDLPTVRIAARLAFEASGAVAPGPLEPAEADRYRRPQEGLIRVTPRVAALAERLTAAGEDPWVSARRFYDFILDTLVCGAVPYDQVDAGAPGDWVLERGWFDCQLGAALFISLCRAKGVPARLVGGYLLYRLAPTNHFWAEVWIAGRGWLPVDFLGWDLSSGGRDAAWRERFVGRLDYRMTTQRLPLQFTGPMSVRLPPAWRMLQARGEGGVAIDFEDLSGALVYRDTMAVTDLGPQA